MWPTACCCWPGSRVPKRTGDAPVLDRDEGREGIESQVLDSVADDGAGAAVDADETCVILRNYLMPCGWSGA